MVLPGNPGGPGGPWGPGMALVPPKQFTQVSPFSPETAAGHRGQCFLYGVHLKSNQPLQLFCYLTKFHEKRKKKKHVIYFSL